MKKPNMKILELKNGKDISNGQPLYFPDWGTAVADMEQRFHAHWDAVVLEECTYKNGVKSVAMKDMRGKIIVKYVKPIQ